MRGSTEGSPHLHPSPCIAKCGLQIKPPFTEAVYLQIPERLRLQRRLLAERGAWPQSQILVREKNDPTNTIADASYRRVSAFLKWNHTSTPNMHTFKRQGGAVFFREKSFLAYLPQRDSRRPPWETGLITLLGDRGKRFIQSQAAGEGMRLRDKASPFHAEGSRFNPRHRQARL